MIVIDNIVYMGIYKHINTGNLYVVVDIYKKKEKGYIDGGYPHYEWITYVTYRRLDVNDQITEETEYIRNADDFISSFERIIHMNTRENVVYLVHTDSEGNYDFFVVDYEEMTRLTKYYANELGIKIKENSIIIDHQTKEIGFAAYTDYNDNPGAFHSITWTYSVIQRFNS